MTEYNSYAWYEGNGQQTDFTVPFPYLEKNHVETRLNGVPTFVVWPNDTTVSFVNGAPNEGSLVEIRRRTPIDAREVNFQDGAKFRADDLNADANQLLFLVQEIRDGLYGGLAGKDMDGIAGDEYDSESIMEEVTQKVAESDLYNDLQTSIEDIDAINQATQDNTAQLADVDELANELGYDQEDLSEASITGYLRENDSLTRVRLLSKRAEENEAAIIEERTVRANELKAVAERNLTLIAKGSAAQENVTVDDVAPEDPAEGDGWVDTSVDPAAYYEWDGAEWIEETPVESDDDELWAAIDEEQQARIEGDEALAEDITTVQTSVDDNTASIETHASSIDGLQAQYTVKIDTGNRVVGFGLASDGTDDTSSGDSFVVRSNNFKVMDPDTDELQIGWDSDANAFLVNGDVVADGTVKADKLDIPQVSGISADLGVMTAGTFKTTSSSTGRRVEVSDSGSYPFWYGSGTKTADNATMYMDADGNAVYRGNLDVESSSTNGSVVIRDNVIKVYDDSGTLRVQLGDLDA